MKRTLLGMLTPSSNTVLEPVTTAMVSGVPGGPAIQWNSVTSPGSLGGLLSGTSAAAGGTILSSADGIVTEIVEMEETEFLKKPMKRIGVFLSVLDVHTNRMPMDGKVTYLNHFPGTYPGPYLDARNKECSSKNEAQTWAFEGPQATLVVRQITGAIARRIVPWRKVGDTVLKGERFGMIRFGSRTEVFVPLDCEVTVQPGQRVKGGETIIARFPQP